MKRSILSLLAGAVIAGSLLSTVAFAIPVPASKKGDVNGDNRVDMRDVNFILQVLVGRTKATPQITYAGDVTGPGGKPDGKVTIQDASILSKAVVGFVKLP